MFVADFFRLVDYEHDFAVASQAGADFFVGRVWGEAAGIAHRRAVYALALPETTLSAPEAPQAKDREFHIAWKWAQQRVAVDVVLFRYLQRRFAPGQGLLCSRHFVFIHQDFRAQDHEPIPLFRWDNC
ncbi:hypothetical protein D9M72_610090 [compost metagenome]